MFHVVFLQVARSTDRIHEWVAPRGLDAVCSRCIDLPKSDSWCVRNFEFLVPNLHGRQIWLSYLCIQPPRACLTRGQFFVSVTRSVPPGF
jgi:hypothetical protein